jgi:translation initiation factor IF-2
MIRLNKVTRDLNVGINTVVEFLQKKGYEIEASPNAKITEEQFAELEKEFSKDMNLKQQSEKARDKQHKDHKAAAAAQQEAPKSENLIKVAVPDEAKPHFKQVGRIDLDSLNRKPAPKQVAPEKPAPKQDETPATQPAATQPAEQKTQETAMEKEQDGVFKIRPT